MRVKRGVAAHKRHKRIMKQTKGMTRVRRSTFKLGRQAVVRALQYAYRDRRNRKRDFRSLWISRINAGAREHGLTYSQLMPLLAKANITLNRKTLSELAATEPKAFAAVIEKVKNK